MMDGAAAAQPVPAPGDLATFAKRINDFDARITPLLATATKEETDAYAAEFEKIYAEFRKTLGPRPAKA